MRVLILCESSGTVREAFRSLGHSAWSSDILPADDGSPYHIKKDCVDVLKSNARWDLIIMNPPCTALAVSGNDTYAKGMPKHNKRLESIDWTTKLWKLATSVCDRVCMENTVGVLPFKPTQYVQPWMFGHPESKKTGLWLHGLPKLEATVNVKEVYDALPRREQVRLHYSAIVRDRWKIRSKTFDCLAQAMAVQWSIKQ